MTALILWPLITLQIVMGAFDTLYHHELTERLAWRPSQRHELRLHGVRNLLYTALFLTLGWSEPHGILAMLLVAVTEDMAGGGQVWTRLYARRAGFPQIIHSAKRFAGPTGLEEHVGFGIGMALTVHTVEAALIFRSAGYFVQLLGRRIALPRWLSPGALTVTHGELSDGWFSFTLELVHPRFGALIRQTAVFREAGT